MNKISRKILVIEDLNILEDLEEEVVIKFKKPAKTRSIPKEKLSRGPGLEKNEQERTICSGKYLGRNSEGEHVVEGRKKGGRHLYHFYFKNTPSQN